MSTPTRYSLRAYTAGGEKVFLPFNLNRFNHILAAAEARGEFSNATLGQALSAATDNTDESGRKHDYLTIEWLERDHETGMTKL